MSLKREHIVLMLIILSGFLVRFVGVYSGLPQKFYEDEWVAVSRAVGFFSGDFNPRFFIYPSFHMYFLYMIYASIKFAGFSLPLFSVEPGLYYLIARMVSVVYGTASIYMIYLIGKKLTSHKVGLLSALVFAALPMHIIYSHYAVYNTHLVFWTLTALYFCIKIPEKNDRRNSLLAGITSGIAASISYVGWILIIPVFISHILRKQNESTRRIRGRVYLNLIVLLIGIIIALSTILDASNISEFIKENLSPDKTLTDNTINKITLIHSLIVTGAVVLIPILFFSKSSRKAHTAFSNTVFNENFWLAVIALIGIFFATSPYLILDYIRAVTDIQALVSVEQIYIPEFAGTPVGWIYYPMVLVEEFGWILPILIVLGVYFSAVNAKTRIQYAILFSWMITYYAVNGAIEEKFLRNILPLYPFMAFFAGLSISKISEKVRKRWVLALVLVAALIHPITLDATFIKSHVNDTRWTSFKWIQDNIGEDSVILREVYTPEIEHSKKNYKVIYVDYRLHEKVDDRMLDDKRVDYVILSSGMDDVLRRDNELLQARKDKIKEIEKQGTLIKKFEPQIIYPKYSVAEPNTGYTIEVYKII